MKNIKFLLAIAMLSVTFSFAQEKQEFKIKILNECNDELSNFGTTYFGENQMIYSSPKKTSKIIKNIWNPNEQPYLELYIADISEDGELVNRKPITREINSRFHESNVVFTKDMSTVYFSRNKYYKKKLAKDEHGINHIAMYKAEVVTPDVWMNIVEMPFNNKDYCVGHPALSADEKTLYFSSEMDGDDDIYKVEIADDGTYSIPEKLSEMVNSKGSSERFPFIDNNILYFSSDREGGYGKLDIYSVSLNGRTKAVNLGTPINSYNDDFSFTKQKGKNYGYFSSNRSNGKGDDDIYYFEGLNESPCMQYAEGVVTDSENGKKIPEATVVLFDADGDALETVIVGRDAKFSFEIDCASRYTVKATKDNYSKDQKDFTSNSNLDLSLDLGLNIGKEPDTPEPVIVVTEPYVPTPVIDYSIPSTSVVYSAYDDCQADLDKVNNIYFDLDKDYIRNDAARELEKVIRLMKRCPNIYVNASSHTDCRSSHEYNQDLSQRRAQSTVDYITKIGNIDSYRIKPIGYGETQLINECRDGVKCSEKRHQMNRRTQFEISNY